MMKAISLWQPGATLVALGVKTIETRSRATKYRGPLAIHAAMRLPAMESWDEDGPCGEIWNGDDCLAQWAQSDRRDYLPEMLPPADKRWWLSTPPQWLKDNLPLGAVVATCELVDCVPIVEYECDKPRSFVCEYPDEGTLPHQQGGLWLIGINALTLGSPRRIEDQRPYGSWAPGRYAWLLDKINPLPEPVPAKGRPGLWEWDATPLATAEGMTA